MAAFQSSPSGGASGMKSQSAPAARAAHSASQPQWRPMTSTTKARWCDAAVDASESSDSITRCSAVSQPIVMSVPHMSLSIEPTRPTTEKTGCASACSCVILPADRGWVRGALSERTRGLARRGDRKEGARTLGDELLEQIGPLLAEEVGAGERAVAADADEGIDLARDHVVRRLDAALARAELLAARRADHGAALADDAGHVAPLELVDHLVRPVHHACTPIRRGGGGMGGVWGAVCVCVGVVRSVQGLA